MKKVRIQPQVDQETAERLRAEGEGESRKLATHAAHILKNHAAFLPPSHVPKNERKK